MNKALATHGVILPAAIRWEAMDGPDEDLSGSVESAVISPAELAPGSGSLQCSFCSKLCHADERCCDKCHQPLPGDSVQL